MNDDNIFNRNLLSLSIHNKELALNLSKCEPSKKLLFKTSRNDYPIPVININGREYSLHSTFDPQKEGNRYASTIKGGGYVVVFGFGAAYHIKALLDRNDVNSILIIDKDISMFKSLLCFMDLSKILSDSRISILIDKNEEYIKNYLPANYLPAISGDFNTVSLRARVDSEPDYFNSIFNSIKSVLNTLSDDYTVQTWFGKRWFINSLSNLEAAEKSVGVLPPQKDVSIIGAGPSLELQIKELKDRRKKTFIISTDTALSCLLNNSVVPDLVISIDCQQITYHHFIGGFPKEIPLILDLASPRFLSNLSDKTLFFTSGHPFSHYVNRNWRQFPFVDTSGGNVTHAAISLAESLSADTIRIYGADFSYPEGKSYARGTYLYPYFMSKSARVSSIETNFYNFLYRNDNIDMEKTDYGFRYNTRPMLSYKERLELFAYEINASIIPAEGMGVKLNFTERKKRKEVPEIFAAGKASTSWQLFLSSYKTKLENLSVPASSPASYFSSLEYSEKDIWTTLFPVAAVFRKKNQNTKMRSSDILNEVKEWALEAINHHLD